VPFFLFLGDTVILARRSSFFFFFSPVNFAQKAFLSTIFWKFSRPELGSSRNWNCPLVAARCLPCHQHAAFVKTNGTARYDQRHVSKKPGQGRQTLRPRQYTKPLGTTPATNSLSLLRLPPMGVSDQSLGFVCDKSATKFSCPRR